MQKTDILDNTFVWLLRLWVLKGGALIKKENIMSELLEKATALGLFELSVKKAAGIGAGLGALAGGAALGAKAFKFAGDVYANPDDPKFNMSQRDIDMIKSAPKEDLKKAQKAGGGMGATVGAAGGAATGAGASATGAALYKKMKGTQKKPAPAAAPA